VSALQNYLFKVYALDTELGAPGGLSKDELLRAMEGCILDERELGVNKLAQGGPARFEGTAIDCCHEVDELV
jgi:hypothetical protein